jgi:two-component system NtrC family sensor kinase
MDTLDKGVKKRTRELERVNRELRTAYKELRKTQAELIQAGKLAAVGELADGVAHEINNPLTSILGRAQLLLTQKYRKSLSPKVIHHLKVIEEQAIRAAKITRNLSGFSRPSEGSFQPLEVNQAIENALSLIERQLFLSDIEVIKKLKPNLPKVLGNETQLQEVFLNLILNARDAMPDKGKLTISAQPKDKEKFVEIAFRDTGCGITGENLEKIFTPFFTTKKEKKAVGLGLSISYRIIKNHNARIEVESKPNKGATFRIKLPAIKKSVKS